MGVRSWEKEKTVEKQNYKQLTVWQRSIKLVPTIYRAIRTFPKVETYALSDQLRRAVVSIPSNIAEGQARQHTKEFLQHLSIAKGSLAEVHTLLVVAHELDYLNRRGLEQIEAELDEIAKMLAGLINSLRTR